MFNTLILWYCALNPQVLEQNNGSYLEIFEKALEQVTIFLYISSRRLLLYCKVAILL